MKLTFFEGVYHHEIFSYCLVYEPEGSRVPLVLSEMYGKAEQVGLNFDCNLVSYRHDSIFQTSSFQRVQQSYRFPEIYPLINARMHPLSSTLRTNPTMRSTNEKVSSNHFHLFEELCWESTPLNEETQNRLTLLFLNEGKIQLAKDIFVNSTNSCTKNCFFSRFCSKTNVNQSQYNQTILKFTFRFLLTRVK
jgi:hypothetical protein